MQSLTVHHIFVRDTLVSSMRYHILAVVVAGLTILLIPGAQTAPCPSNATVELDVATAADLQTFTDAINCTGPGVFNITWCSSLTIEQTIEVSNQKKVTIRGSGFHTIRDALDDDDDDGIGIFSVFNGSSLRLEHLVLEGGLSEHGGAVAVLASSYLHVVDCIITNNKASRGGEKLFLGNKFLPKRFLLAPFRTRPRSWAIV